MTATVSGLEPIAANAEEHSALERIACLLRQPAADLELGAASGVAAELPTSLGRLLVQCVEILARGEAVAVVPVRRDLTTQETADMLNMSRQYLVRLLDSGAIPHHKVGSHRRVKLADAVAYRERRDEQRGAILNRLDELSQDGGEYE